MVLFLITQTQTGKKQQFSLSSWELLSFFQDKDFNLIEYIVFLAKPQPYNYTPDCRHLFPGKSDRYTYWRIHIYIDIPCLAENHVRLPQVLDRVFPRRILWDNMNPHPISQTSLTFTPKHHLIRVKMGVTRIKCMISQQHMFCNKTINLH